MNILKRVFISFLFFLSLGFLSSGPLYGASGSSGNIAMNFHDVEISTVVRFISETTGKNFIYDNRLKGKITIIAPRELSRAEAFDLFVSVMELKGFTVINTGSAYRVSPLSMIKQGPVAVSKGKERPLRANELYMARLIPLEHLTPGDLLPVLTPIVSRQGYMAAFGTSNSILILDTARNINKILKVVEYLDIKGISSPSELVMLKYAMAEEMVETLNKYKSGGGKGVVMAGQPPMSPLASKKIAIAVKRLNAVIIIGNDAERQKLRDLITLLDVRPSEVRSRINVYYLENADAGELAKTLEKVMSSAPSSTMTTGGKPKKPVKVQSRFTYPIVITPDVDTNSLIIMAQPDDYLSLVDVIKQLDRRPSQVYVEAMIVEVSVDRARDLGTKWRLAAEQNGAPVTIGGFGSVDSSTMSNIVSGLAGFSLGGVGNLFDFTARQPDGSTVTLGTQGFSVLFNLSDFKDVVNVLSTPQILTSDNQEAEIVVGDNVPFLSSLERSSSTTNQPVLQSIERKDVGVTLKIKPQISKGEYIKLDIYQEISSVTPTTQTAGVSASDIITSKRSAKTTVVVKDRQTIVIGGLIQDKIVKNDTRVPVLSKIPLLGWLFKSTTKSKEKTNLLVYLTPTIVRDFDDLKALKEKKDKEFRDASSTPALDDKGGAERPVEK
ncbi:MAG: type II secretion system secretin GspD [Thermodesulfobacteriota bacterium]